MLRNVLAVAMVGTLLQGCIFVSSDDERGDRLPGEPCTETQECVPGSICFNEFCVGDGSLRISLAWNADSDYDLHVLTPSGAEIYFGRTSADGGELDVDQCITSCGNSTHVENVNFADFAPSGPYDVWVENYDGRGGGDFDIEVSGDYNDVFFGALPASSSAVSEVFSFDL